MTATIRELESGCLFKRSLASKFCCQPNVFFFEKKAAKVPPFIKEKSKAKYI
jgi:hypothetical protein